MGFKAYKVNPNELWTRYTTTERPIEIFLKYVKINTIKLNTIRTYSIEGKRLYVPVMILAIFFLYPFQNWVWTLTHALFWSIPNF